jgi:class 3 adenylate cyclase
LRGIVVTDIVGSTELTARLGDVAALELIRVHDAIVRRALARHDGREVKHIGDGIMAAFGQVANAVRAAADIQLQFQKYNSEATESLRVRIGIHAGEPVADQTVCSARPYRWRSDCAAKSKGPIHPFADMGLRVFAIIFLGLRTKTS